MDSKKYKEMYNLVEKAKRYEKQGNRSKELEIYEQIHRDYLPNSSKLYKRPAVLYEKKGEYQKSLNLCQEALELIESEKISGTTKSFEKMIKILNRKINDNDPPIKQEKPKRKLRITLSGIIFVLIIIAFIAYSLTAESSYENLEVDLSNLESIDDQGVLSTPPPENYPITEEMIIKAREKINKNPSVIESVIISEGSVLGFGALVEESTSYTNSKNIAEDFIKYLGNEAAREYDLKGALLSNYGEIYDYYTLYISVGTSNKAEDIIFKAYKLKKSSQLIIK